MSGEMCRIRRARITDVPSIAAIEKESFPDPWGGEIFTDAITCFPTTFFVATCDERLAGFIVGGIEDTGDELYGHICNLAVTSSQRNRGIGRQLVKRIEHQFVLESASGIQLEVRISNLRAQSFYRKIGYKEAFAVSQYYANGEDALLMMKWFRY
ncbi:MAG TPA: ribosomal protein S18-alanine N-acetyltransferase [Methanoregulaceae archaeon]|nr:ribosomal protein S18-alanine N-acetyltransferase [Methanoregulaceae archaeon]